MIYLSPDYESDGEEFWDDLLRRNDCVLQYPWEIGPGDICLVDARLGAEYVPGKVGGSAAGIGGGIVVAVVLHDFHIERRERERLGKKNAADLNPAIHRTNGCCVKADRVAVVDGRMAGEIGRVVGEEFAGEDGWADGATGGGAVDIDVVGDWGKYLDGLKEIAR